MARIRSIHPDACDSRKLGSISADAERLWWRLLTHCDDEGRCEDDPRLIYGRVAIQIEGWHVTTVDALLVDLAAVGLLERYEVDGQKLIQVSQWERFQHPQKKKDSTLPPPGDTATGPVRDESDSGSSPQEPCGDTGSVWRGVGEGEGAGAGLPAIPLSPAERRKLIAAAAVVVADRQGKPEQSRSRGEPAKWLAGAIRGITGELTEELADQRLDTSVTAESLADLLAPPPDPTQGFCPDCGARHVGTCEVPADYVAAS